MNVNEVKVLTLALQLCLFYSFNLKKKKNLPTYKYVRPQYREVSNQDSFHQWMQLIFKDYFQWKLSNVSAFSHYNDTVSLSLNVFSFSENRASIMNILCHVIKWANFPVTSSICFLPYVGCIYLVSSSK